ncbi:MAG: PEP-CTERM sorting domain-containing protein [Luteolibacter sp.]
MKIVCQVVLCAILSVTVARSAVILRGDFQHGTAMINGTTTPTLEITEDIDFSILSSGIVKNVVFLYWGSNPLESNVVNTSPSTQTVGISMNGGPTFFIDILSLLDTTPITILSATAPGMLTLNGITVSPGDILTVRAGSFTFDSTPSFNSSLLGKRFEGNMVLTDESGDSLSEVWVVPEPSSLIVMCISFLIFFRRNRK